MSNIESNKEYSVNKAPFFSVVIPTYNRPDYLREAVASVLAQTFADFEVIVVDDSPEKTGCPVVRSFSDARLTYLRNDHSSGGAGTRNAGIERARGEWVAFLDDDDIWLPEKLERQAEKIATSDDNVALVYTGHTTFRQGSEHSNTFVPDKEGWIYEDLLAWNVIGGFYSVAIRRDILTAVGGLDERFPAMQDLELYIRVAKEHKVAFVADPLVRVRDSLGNRITTNHANKLRASQLFREKFKSDIAESLYLKHRVSSRIFMFAFAEGDVGKLFKNAPLTLAGLVMERKSIENTLRFIARVSLARLKSTKGNR